MAEGLSGKRLYVKSPRGFQWWWLIWVAAGLCLFFCGAALGVVSHSGGSSWIGSIIDKPFDGASQVSLLIAGEDNSTKEGNSDMLMVAMFSPGSGTMSALSIPRDTRVEVPGVGFTRINAASCKGGIELTKQVVERLLGIRIDYYIDMHVDGLVKLVDAMGGIDLDVEKHMHYTDRTQHLYIDLQPGRQHLTGYQAMGYVRFRHDATSDFGRVERQRKFLRAVIAKMLSPDHVAAVPAVARVFLDTVKTNLTFRDILALERVIEDGNPDAARMATLPATPVSVHGASMVDVDPEQVRQMVQQVLLRQGMTVAVFNATDSAGLASNVAALLQKQGCQVVTVGNAKHSSDTTLVIDHGTQAHRAERVAQWLGRGVISMQPDGESASEVTVIAGRDLLKGTPAQL